METSIPKIIHQLWIGPKPAPLKLMNTWKEKNPDFKYILWNEEKFIEEGIIFECQDKIDDMVEICGKADIMRWELLYRFGGIFIDADSYCIEPFNTHLLNCNAFAGWENEERRPGLIAIGTMGFPPKHPIIAEAIKRIKLKDVAYHRVNKRAWQTVGPVLLTEIYNSGFNKLLNIFPSYYFLPYHFTGTEYIGHGIVFAHQEWGSTNQSYDKMNNSTIPINLLEPKLCISLLINSSNLTAKVISECLNYIRDLQGLYTIEIVWINNSDELHTTILTRLLDNFKLKTRFIHIKCINAEFDNNHLFGLEHCSFDIINIINPLDINDDINRIYKQLIYLSNNPDKNIDYDINIINKVCIRKHILKIYNR